MMMIVVVVVVMVTTMSMMMMVVVVVVVMVTPMTMVSVEQRGQEPSDDVGRGSGRLQAAAGGPGQLP